jgi:hypothetical protein
MGYFVAAAVSAATSIVVVIGTIVWGVSLPKVSVSEDYALQSEPLYYVLLLSGLALWAVAWALFLGGWTQRFGPDPLAWATTALLAPGPMIVYLSRIFSILNLAGLGLLWFALFHLACFGLLLGCAGFIATLGMRGQMAGLIRGPSR